MQYIEHLNNCYKTNKILVTTLMPVVQNGHGAALLLKAKARY